MSGNSFENGLRFSALVLSAFVLFFSSCTPNVDDYGPQTEGGENPVAPKDRTIILNEGNFMFSNGSVSVLNNITGEVANQVYRAANNVPIGDVPQSMLIHDSLAFIIVNNSGKIEVVDKTNFVSIKTITGLTSPRFMAIVNQNPLTGWVTDLYANKIWKVDLEQGYITGNIPLNGWGENILIHTTDAYVLNKTDSVIHVLDLATESVKQTYDLGNGIVDFKKMNENELVVISVGGMYKIDMTQSKVDTLYTFPVLRNPTRLAVDTTEQIVYFLEMDVFSVDLKPAEFNIYVFQAKPPSANLYGMEVNSQNGFVYLTNSKDYVQNGEVLVLDRAGNEVGKYVVGINPQFILFD